VYICCCSYDVRYFQESNFAVFSSLVGDTFLSFQTVMYEITAVYGVSAVRVMTCVVYHMSPLAEIKTNNLFWQSNF